MSLFFPFPLVLNNTQTKMKAQMCNCISLTFLNNRPDKTVQLKTSALGHLDSGKSVLCYLHL